MCALLVLLSCCGVRDAPPVFFRFFCCCCSGGGGGGADDVDGAGGGRRGCDEEGRDEEYEDSHECDDTDEGRASYWWRACVRAWSMRCGKRGFPAELVARR